MKTCVQVISASIFLTACAAPTPALRQSINTTETITITNTSTVRDFGFSVMRDDYDCYGFLPKGNNDLTVALTQKPFVTINYQFIDIRSLPIVKSCKGTYTFRKNGSKRYTAHIGSNEKTCSISVYGHSEDNPDKSTLMHLTPREFTQPAFDGMGPWCKAGEEFRGSTDYINARPNTSPK